MGVSSVVLTPVATKDYVSCQLFHVFWWNVASPVNCFMVFGGMQLSLEVTAEVGEAIFLVAFSVSPINNAILSSMLPLKQNALPDLIHKATTLSSRLHFHCEVYRKSASHLMARLKDSRGQLIADFIYSLIDVFIKEKKSFR